MQKNPTANERHLHSFAFNNQLPAAAAAVRAAKQSTLIATSHAVRDRTAATDSPAVSPALASLAVTDSPHSPSSQLAFASSRSQPSSPSSPGAPRSHVRPASLLAPSDSAPPVVGCLPVTPSAAGGARIRVPLGQVVTSLTQRWSTEYLAEAEAGDVDAQCLVAQMFLTGWGALKEDQAEGKRWLQRAKAGGIAGTVNKLELLYLGDHDTSCVAGTATACGDHSAHANPLQLSPSTGSLASFMPTPTSSFFASVAATISPRPLAGGAGSGSGAGRLGVVGAERMVVGVGSGSSSSGDEHSHHLHHEHGHHWHMHHSRVHSSELGVSAS